MDKKKTTVKIPSLKELKEYEATRIKNVNFKNAYVANEFSANCFSEIIINFTHASFGANQKIVAEIKELLERYK